MTRKITTHSEASSADCRTCNWSVDFGTSRQIRKAANRHAGYERHIVDIWYDSAVTVDCRVKPATPSQAANGDTALGGLGGGAGRNEDTQK